MRYSFYTLIEKFPYKTGDVLCLLKLFIQIQLLVSLAFKEILTTFFNVFIVHYVENIQLSEPNLLMSHK